MKKSILSVCIIVLVLVLALFAFTACNTSEIAYGDELIVNGKFSSFTESKFDGWKIRQDWDSSTQYGKEPLGDDNYCLYLENVQSGCSYLYQEVKVDRKEIYKVSVDVKLDGAVKIGKDTDFKGAFVTFLENPDYFFVEQTEKYAENSGWKTLVFYVKPANTDYLTICLKLGDEDAESIGKAYFDNVSMIKVAEAPSDVKVTNFKKAEISRYNSNVNGILFITLLSIFTLAVIVVAYVIIRRLYSRNNAFDNFDMNVKNSNKKLAFTSHPAFIASMLAIGTGLVNLIFLLTMYGFGSEMDYTVTLARILGQNGAVRTAYATQSSLSSTAPGVIYILSIIGFAGAKLDVSAVSILIRFINVLATMATVVMIYFYGRKYVGDKQSTIYAALYAILPITLVMSGLDNTFTALLVAMLIGTMYLAVEKQYLPTYLMLGLATVLDVRALAIAPIVIGYFVYRYIKDDDNKKKFTSNRAQIVFGLVAMVALVYALTIPVAIDYIAAKKPFYGFKIIANEIINNSIFVDNALGLYGMATMNQKTSSQTASVLNICFIVILEAYVLSLYFKNRNKQELIMLASFTLAILAVFTLKVDYTYIFLAIALGFIYTMISGEKRMFAILGAYSIISFLNIAQVMNNSNFVQGTAFFEQNSADNMYFVNFETTSPDFIIFCVLAVIVSLYYGYVSYSISNNGKLVDIPAMEKPFITTMKEWFKSFGTNFKKFFSKPESEE